MNTKQLIFYKGAWRIILGEYLYQGKTQLVTKNIVTGELSETDDIRPFAPPIAMLPWYYDYQQYLPDDIKRILWRDYLSAKHKAYMIANGSSDEIYGG